MTKVEKGEFPALEQSVVSLPRIRHFRVCTTLAVSGPWSAFFSNCGMQTVSAKL